MPSPDAARDLQGHVGVVLPTREALRTGRPALVASFARAAEAHGFGSLWAGDSLLARPLFDPLTVLATAAAVTTVPRLGTGVLLAPLRPPALTAQALASLDQLSAGRLIVGVGRGFDLPETRREFAAAGADFGQRTRRMVDTVAFWREAWSGHGTVSMATPYARLDGETLLPGAAQPGGPPIWLAGFGPGAFRRAGRLADGWLPYPPSAADYRSGWERVQEAAEEAGRDPARITPAMMVTINIAADGASTRALDDYAAGLYGYSFEVVSLIQACRAGSRAEILDFLRGFWDAGARAFVLRVASLDAPERQLDAVADGVLPAVEQWSTEVAGFGLDVGSAEAGR
jgi:alkanesulfonate monooxygenase SsuD/methylene tetrahydromethanopterin reductase-like flavin-dependent oxidoreductase (luciferase family)